jgi:hypothetical protein
MVDCVFCRIVEGIVPASVVYSDENVIAFLDAQPVNAGHVLIIPRTHARGKVYPKPKFLALSRGLQRYCTLWIRWVISI